MIKVYIKLIRPPLAIMGFLAPWAVGSYYNLDTHTLVNVTGAIGFGNMAFVIANEIADEKQDRINKPWKPIPSGEVDKSKAVALSLSFFIMSVYCLHTLPLGMIKYGLVGYLTSTIYNVLKVREAIGNACLGFTYFISAYMATGLTDMTFPLAFGVLTIAHNLLVQLQDMEADKKAGVSTFPIEYGEVTTRIVAVVLGGLAGYLFAMTGQCIFAIAGCLVLTVAVLPAKKVIELLVRIGVRLMMLLGFLFMGRLV